MSDSISETETATLFEFFSLLAAGKHDGNAHDEFVPVMEKMTCLSRKKNNLQSLGKDCSKVNISIEVVSYSLTINKELDPSASAQGPLHIVQKSVRTYTDENILAPSTITLPYATKNGDLDTQHKIMGMSAKTSIDEDVPIGYPLVMVRHLLSLRMRCG